MSIVVTIEGETISYPDSDQDGAMRDYYAALTAGKSCLIRKSGPSVPVPPAPVSAADAGRQAQSALLASRRAPVAPVPYVEPGKGISSVAVDRIARHEKSLADRGIALPPPIYAAGTRVVAMGDDNFRQSRQEWEAMPETTAGLEGVIKAVRAERREDFDVQVRSIAMRTDGTIDWCQGPVHLEDSGLAMLIARNSALFPRAGEYMAAINPDLRAVNWNHRIRSADPTHRVKLRTRIGADGKAQVYAVTSTSYAPFDADRIAERLIGALEGSGMRGAVVYDPATTNLRADGLYHADKVVDLAAGDVFKVGMQFRSNDSAGGSIRCSGVAWRNLCLNLIIIGTGEVEIMRRRHIGRVQDVAIDVDNAADRARNLFEDFAQEWRILRAASAVDVLGTDNAKDALSMIAEMSAFKDVGLKRDAIVEMLLEGLAAEPGDTLADMVNAVSRAHLLSSVDNWRREKFEEAAGVLVPALATMAQSSVPSLRSMPLA